MQVNHHTVENSNMNAHHGKNESFHVDYHNNFLPIEGYENMPLVSPELAVEPLMTRLPSI